MKNKSLTAPTWELALLGERQRNHSDKSTLFLPEIENIVLLYDVTLRLLEFLVSFVFLFPSFFLLGTPSNFFTFKKNITF